jgi:hypothetical protein
MKATAITMRVTATTIAVTSITMRVTATTTIAVTSIAMRVTATTIAVTSITTSAAEIAMSVTSMAAYHQSLFDDPPPSLDEHLAWAATTTAPARLVIFTPAELAHVAERGAQGETTSIVDQGGAPRAVEGAAWLAGRPSS